MPASAPRASPYPPTDQPPRAAREPGDAVPVASLYRHGVAPPMLCALSAEVVVRTFLTPSRGRALAALAPLGLRFASAGHRRGRAATGERLAPRRLTTACRCLAGQPWVSSRAASCPDTPQPGAWLSGRRSWCTSRPIESNQLPRLVSVVPRSVGQRSVSSTQVADAEKVPLADHCRRIDVGVA